MNDQKGCLVSKKEPSGTLFRDDIRSVYAHTFSFSFSVTKFRETTPDTLACVRLREELIGIFAGLMRWQPHGEGWVFSHQQNNSDLSLVKMEVTGLLIMADTVDRLYCERMCVCVLMKWTGAVCVSVLRRESAWNGGSLNLHNRCV